jgi:Fic family protein
MFWPKFTISGEILKNIGSIESARAIIDNAALIPAYENQFREDAAARTVHHGTHIEGNDLSLNQAKQLLDGERIAGRPRDIQEILNYRRVLDYIEKIQQRPGKDFKYSLVDLKKIHSLTVERLLPEEKCGRFRDKKVVVKDSATNQVKFIPPLPIEVPYQLKDFFSWLNDTEGKNVHPVLRAGISHYELVRIHPFIDGNGRVARAFATLVLFREGYDIKRFFALEEYYDNDPAAYYQALQSVSVTNDLTNWLEYFTYGLSVELAKVKEKVEALSLDSGLRDKLGKQITLSTRQMKLIKYMKDKQAAPMGDIVKLFPMVSDDTLLRDIRDLIKKGIIVRQGKTRGVIYRLVQ